MTNPGLTLDDVLAAEIIRLVLRPENGVCMGPCEQVFISVRAVLGTGDGLFEDMVELSPLAYVEAPNRADNGRLVYQLSGATLARIVALDFKRSFGFRNQQSFALTRGFIFGLYQSLTTRKSEMRYSGLVWSTDAKPDKADLLEGVPEEDRSEVEILQRQSGVALALNLRVGTDLHCFPQSRRRASRWNTPVCFQKLSRLGKINF